MPKANPASAIYKFHGGKKKSWKLQKCLAQSGLQPLAAGDLEGCIGDLGTVTGQLGVRGVLGHLVMRVGDCPEPPGVPGAQLQMDSPTHTTSVCNVRVCVTKDRNISSATLNPQTRKMPVSVAEIPEIKGPFGFYATGSSSCNQERQSAFISLARFW